MVGSGTWQPWERFPQERRVNVNLGTRESAWGICAELEQSADWRVEHNI
jgi:hypothetical protein